MTQTSDKENEVGKDQSTEVQQDTRPESVPAEDSSETNDNGEAKEKGKGKKYSSAWFIPIILLLLIGYVDWLFADSWDANHNPASDLPIGAAVYAEFSAPWNEPGISKILESKSYQFLCSSSEGDNIWASLKANYSDQLVDKEFTHPALKFLKAAFGFDGSTYVGGKIGVALYGIEGGEPDAAISIAKFLPVKFAGLTKAMGLLPKGFKFQQKRMGSVNNPFIVYEIKNEKHEFYIASYKSRILITTTASLMQKIAMRKFEPLSGTEEFKAFSSWEASSTCRFFFAPDKFVENLAASFTPGTAAASGWKYFNKLFNKIAFDGFNYKWVGLTLDFPISADGTVTVSGNLKAPLNEETSETATIELPIIKEPEAAKVLPEDSYFAFCWEKDVENLWQDILEDQHPKDLAEIKADPTSKIFEETFFPAMAKVHTLALVPQTLDESISKEFPFPSLVICFGLKDPDAFSEVVYDTVDNFMDEQRLKYKDNESAPIPFIDRRLSYKGIEINYFDITDNKVKGAIVPTYIFLDNYWIISTSIEGAKKCIDAVKDGKSLYTTKKFQAQNLSQYSPSSGWMYFEPQGLSMDFNTNATVWNENLVKIDTTNIPGCDKFANIPLSELKYRPDEQARYQNLIRLEQFRRKKNLDRITSATYNLSPSMAIYSESKTDLIWTFKVNIR